MTTALLADGHVLIEANPGSLERPFLVLSTQNPTALEGTYTAPETQLDRLLIRMSAGYPSEDRAGRDATGDRPGRRS